jgi:hypothetical protein
MVPSVPGFGEPAATDWRSILQWQRAISAVLKRNQTSMGRNVQTGIMAATHW